MNFNAQWVDRAPVPPKGRTDYYDQKLTGLGLRVSHTGRKVWFVMYRVKGDPVRHRLTLGQYPNVTLADAREAAQHVIVEGAAGHDPGQERREHENSETFGDLARDYIEKHAKQKKRSWAEDERILEHDLLPAWARRKARDISRRDVHKLLDAIVDRGASIQANRTLALVRKIFNWGIGRDIVLQNPCQMIPAPAKERPRDRVLSDDEIRAVWRAFDQLGPIMGGMFKLRLLTAQRGGEVMTMRWQDIDRAGRSWTIPADYSKNGRSHFVPLSAAAINILEELAELTGHQDWVFPSPTRSDQPIQNVQKAAARVRRLSEIDDFVLHDLRRTAASNMTSMRIPRLVVSKILNHADQGVTQVYDRHIYDQEKREALERWAAELLIKLEGPGADAGEAAE